MSVGLVGQAEAVACSATLCPRQWWRDFPRGSSPRSRAYLKWISEGFAEAPIYIPSVVRAECTTGFPSVDTLINRFLNTIDDPNNPGHFWLDTTAEIGGRAGVLRTDVLATGSGKPSGVDSIVVAHAEALASRFAVTIITSDGRDIEALVAATRRPNIAVEVI